MEKTDLLGMTTEELKTFATEQGQPPFRGKQLFKWLNKGVKDFSQMSDLPDGFRTMLEEKACTNGVETLKVQHDRKDGTRKFLFGLTDGSAIESVFMKYRYGNTLCVSSQVGCRMGCVFCASTLDGLVRGLTAGEMADQIFEAERQTGETINHIVVMGMGEPFDNYDNLKKFLTLIHDPQGRNMSYRNMTVSTSGIIPVIKRFSGDFPQVNLAISLHRIDDEGRSSIMPVNRAYPVKDLLKAADEYTEETGRRITFEYTLIKGENDSEKDVDMLIRSLKGRLCHINLIPLNKVDETGLSGSSRKRALEICARLEKAGIAATVRRELGSAIDGACGQLRLSSNRL